MEIPPARVKTSGLKERRMTSALSSGQTTRF
jgi:hypothetical protein